MITTERDRFIGRIDSEAPEWIPISEEWERRVRERRRLQKSAVDRSLFSLSLDGPLPVALLLFVRRMRERKELGRERETAHRVEHSPITAALQEGKRSSL